MNEKFSKEKEIWKKDQIEILKMNNSISQIKNTVESLKNTMQKKRTFELRNFIKQSRPERKDEDSFEACFDHPST